VALSHFISMSDQDIPDADGGRVRLDKWLWAARFYKTRSAAAEAIGGGKVDVNGERAKRAKPLQAGDAILIRQPPFEIHLVVRALSERRGGAAAAALLYEETAASRTTRAALAAQIRSLPAIDREVGRPTKKERRTLNRWRGR
jgi:ribosome-associated heat shock protein Hsp15